MPMRLKKLTFLDVPDWAIGPDRSRYSIAATFTLCGAWRKPIKLSANSQCAVFGAYLFGKCSIVVHEAGLTISKKVCFGTDFTTLPITWDELDVLIATGKALHY
jgi:hypothetical protein